MTLPPGLQRTALYSRYAKELLRERIEGLAARLSPDIPLHMQIELERIVDRFHRAWQNRITLPYRMEDVQRVLDSTPKNKEDVLRSRFTGPFPENAEGTLRLLTTPAAFVDLDQRIAGWYFPSMFTPERSEHVYKSVKALSCAPKSVLVESRTRRRKKTRTSKNWRNDESVYRPLAKSELTPGNVVMSLCWYNQGWGPQNDRPPAPSADLRPNGGGPEFLASECDTNALIGVILSLVHPELYDLQMEVLAELHAGKIDVQHPELLEQLFEHWSSPFTAFALISNRETPLHRDTRGGKMLLDLLATFGRYTQGRLEVPLLGARFVYNPSTALLFPGYLLEHGASAAEGERICMASFIRPNVGYGVLPQYEEILLPKVKELADALGIQRLTFGRR